MKKKFTLVVLSFLSVVGMVSAQSFSAFNADSVKIYYDILSEDSSKVEVTYDGDDGSKAHKDGVDSYVGKVRIPSQVVNDGDTFTVVAIGDRAFHRCYELTDVEIPITVREIADRSFQYTRIQNLYVPDSVTFIGERAFSECYNLNTIELGMSVKEIGDYAFYSENIETLISRNIVPATLDGDIFVKNIRVFVENAVALSNYENSDWQYHRLYALDAPNVHELSFVNLRIIPDYTVFIVQGEPIGKCNYLLEGDSVVSSFTIDGTVVDESTLYTYSEDKTAVAQWEKALIMKTDTVVITDSILFLDHQGFGDYLEDQADELILVPGDDNSMVKVDLVSYEFESGYDYLYIYNGTSTNSPKLAQLSGKGNQLSYCASNVNGILKVDFSSDGGTNKSGWTAIVSLVPKGANVHKLSFDAASDDVSDIDTLYVEQGEEIGVLPRPSRDGYAFMGWEIDSTEINKDTQWTYTEDKTAVAYWEKHSMFVADYTDSVLTIAESDTSIANLIDILYSVNTDEVRKVVFSSPVERESIIVDDNMGSLFYEWNNLDTIVGLEYINTVNVTYMSEMFYGCDSLKSLDLSNFNTANVTDMSEMFENCKSLKSLDLSSFNTYNVADMSDMFDDCQSLISLDLSSFNTENVEEMDDMFNDCQSLKSLDLSNFNTKNVTDMANMFDGCKSLKVLDLSNFNTSNVDDMSNMFEDCDSLISLDLSNFNTSNVDDMDNMFEDCQSLINLNLSSFNTSNVDDMEYMFEDCKSLKVLDLSNFNTENVEYMTSMFEGCDSLISLNLSNFNTANVTDMSEMFEDCASLKSLDLINFNTANVEYMYDMFAGCGSLKSLDLSSFNTEYVASMSSMFYGCASLQSLDLSNFNTEYVEYMYDMFKGCTSLKSLDLSSFNTEYVNDIDEMFVDVRLSYVVLSDRIQEGISAQILPVEGDMYVSPSVWLREGGDGTEYDSIPTVEGYAAEGVYRVKGLVYNLSFDLNGGAGVADTIEVMYNSPIGALPSVSKEGYDFVCWKVGEDIITSETVWMYTTDTQAVANLELVDYMITVDLAGGMYVGDDTVPSFYTIESDTIVLPTTLTRANSDTVGGKYTVYTFAGWSAEEDIVTEIAKGSTGNRVLTATWDEEVKELVFYALSFDLNGGAGVADTIEVMYNSPIGALPSVSKEGYDFVCWKVGEDTITSETVWMYTTDTQAVANWELVDYMITVDLAGGMYVGDDTVPSFYTIESDTIVLPTTLTRENSDTVGGKYTVYTFAGWIAEEDIVTEIAKGSTGDIVLTATWDEDTVEVPVGLEDVFAVVPFVQEGNMLYFGESQQVALYTVSGIMLYNGVSDTLELPGVGVYVVVTSEGSYKVLGM